MLPAANRLRRAVDFQENGRRGSRSSRGHVVAVVALGVAEQDEPARIGLVVGRRVGGSVVRHRVARRLRAAARPAIAKLPGGSTVVLRAQPGAADDAKLVEDARGAIESALRRAVRRLETTR